MPERQSVLVSVDDSPEFPTTLGRARRYAQQLDAPLSLVSVLYDPYVAGRRFGDSEGLKKLRRAVMQRELEGLEVLCNDIAKSGLEVSGRVVWDRPKADALARQVMALDPLMLVVSAHRTRLVDKLLLSYTDWQVLSRVPCPVLRVADRPYADKPVIAVAVDPMHDNDKPAAFDDRLIASAAGICDGLGGELALLHAVQDLQAVVMLTAPGGGAMPVADADLQTALEDEHRKRLQALAERHGVDRRNLHVASGIDTMILSEFAESLRADVMVMGVVSRSRFKEVVIGNTAERLIERLSCDLLAVKPEGFECPVQQSSDVDVLSTGAIKPPASAVESG
ncbi:MAG: universal stress protein [Pseudomonadota bacterium]